MYIPEGHMASSILSRRSVFLNIFEAFIVLEHTLLCVHWNVQFISSALPEGSYFSQMFSLAVDSSTPSTVAWTKTL